MRNISGTSCRENKNTYIIFPENGVAEELMWKKGCRGHM
jgi:hypothetical protein